MTNKSTTWKFNEPVELQSLESRLLAPSMTIQILRHLLWLVTVKDPMVTGTTEVEKFGFAESATTSVVMAAAAPPTMTKSGELVSSRSVKSEFPSTHENEIDSQISTDTH